MIVNLAKEYYVPPYSIPRGARSTRSRVGGHRRSPGRRRQVQPSKEPAPAQAIGGQPQSGVVLHMADQDTGQGQFGDVIGDRIEVEALADLRVCSVER